MPIVLMDLEFLVLSFSLNWLGIKMSKNYTKVSEHNNWNNVDVIMNEFSQRHVTRQMEAYLFVGFFEKDFLYWVVNVETIQNTF